MKFTARLDTDLTRRLHLAGERIAARAVARRSRIVSGIPGAPPLTITSARSTAPPAAVEASPPPPIEQPGGA